MSKRKEIRCVDYFHFVVSDWNVVASITYITVGYTAISDLRRFLHEHSESMVLKNYCEMTHVTYTPAWHRPNMTNTISADTGSGHLMAGGGSCFQVPTLPWLAAGIRAGHKSDEKSECAVARAEDTRYPVLAVC